MSCFDPISKDCAFIEQLAFPHSKRVWHGHEFRDNTVSDVTKDSMSQGKYRLLNKSKKVISEINVSSDKVSMNNLSTLLSWKCDQSTVRARFCDDIDSKNLRRADGFLGDGDSSDVSLQCDDTIFIEFDNLKVVSTQSSVAIMKEVDASSWSGLHLKARLHWLGDTTNDTWRKGSRIVPPSVELDLSSSIEKPDSLSALSLNGLNDKSMVLKSLMDTGSVGGSGSKESEKEDPHHSNTSLRCGVSLHQMTSFTNLLPPPCSTSNSTRSSEGGGCLDPTAALVIELIGSRSSSHNGNENDEDDDEDIQEEESVVLSMVKIPCSVQSPLISALKQPSLSFLSSSINALVDTEQTETENHLANRDAKSDSTNSFTWFPTISQALCFIFDGNQDTEESTSHVHDGLSLKIWERAPMILGWIKCGGGYIVVCHRKPMLWQPVPTTAMGSLELIDVASDSVSSSSNKERNSSSNKKLLPMCRYAEENLWVNSSGGLDIAMKNFENGFPDFGIDVWSLACALSMSPAISSNPKSSTMKSKLMTLESDTSNNSGKNSHGGHMLRSFWWGRVNACIPSRAASLVTASSSDDFKSKESCTKRLIALNAASGRHSDPLELSLFLGSYNFRNYRSKSPYCQALEIAVGGCDIHSTTLLFNYIHALSATKGLTLLPWIWDSTTSPIDPKLLSIIQSKKGASFYMTARDAKSEADWFTENVSFETSSKTIVYLAVGEWTGIKTALDSSNEDDESDDDGDDQNGYSEEEEEDRMNNSRSDDNSEDESSGGDQSDASSEHVPNHKRSSSSNLPFLFIPIIIERKESVGQSRSGSSSSHNSAYVIRSCGTSLINPLILADTDVATVITKLVDESRITTGSGVSKITSSKQPRCRPFEKDMDAINFSVLSHYLTSGEVNNCCSLVASLQDPLQYDASVDTSSLFPLPAFFSSWSSDASTPDESYRVLGEMCVAQPTLISWSVDCFPKSPVANMSANESISSKHGPTVGKLNEQHSSLSLLGSDVCSGITSVVFELDNQQKDIVKSVLNERYCISNKILMLDGLPGSGRTTGLLATALAFSLSSVPSNQVPMHSDESISPDYSETVFGSSLFIGPRHKSLIATASVLEASLRSKGRDQTSISFSSSSESMVLVLSHDDASRVINTVHDLIANLTLEAGARKDEEKISDDQVNTITQFIDVRKERIEAKADMWRSASSTGSSSSLSTTVGLLSLNRIENLRSNEQKCTCDIVNNVFNKLRSDVFDDSNKPTSQSPSEKDRISNISKRAVLNDQQSEQLLEAIDLIKAFVRKHGNISLTSASLHTALGKAAAQDVNNNNDTYSHPHAAPLSSAAQVIAANLDLEMLVSHPGWHLAVGMFPIVLATPESLNKWLPYYHDANKKVMMSPKWKVAVVDDSTLIPWYALSSIISRASIIVLSGGGQDYGKSTSTKKLLLKKNVNSIKEEDDSVSVLSTSTECSFLVAKNYSINTLVCLKGSHVSPMEAAMKRKPNRNKRNKEDATAAAVTVEEEPIMVSCELPLSGTVCSVLKGRANDEPLASSSRNKQPKKKKDTTTSNDLSMSISDGSKLINDFNTTDDDDSIPSVRVISGSKWIEVRVGSRLDSSLDCLSRVLSSVVRYDQSPSLIKACRKSVGDRTVMMGAVYDTVRKLRCAWVNEEEAAAVVAEAWRVQNSLPWARVGVVAMSAMQGLLIETILQLIYAASASEKSTNSNKVSVGLSTDVGSLNMNADVLLISFTHSLNSSSGGSRRGQGAGRLAVKRSVGAVEYLVKWGARFQTVVFASPGQTPLYRRATERGSVATTSSLFSSLGKLLVRQVTRTFSMQPSIKNKDVGVVDKSWVNKFYECMQTLSLSDAAFQGAEFKYHHLTGCYEQASLITNYDSVVICHSDLSASSTKDSKEWFQTYFVVLPNLLLSNGYKKVLQVFESELQSLSRRASSTSFEDVATSYARDLCSWQSSLSDLLEVCDIDATNASITLKSAFDLLSSTTTILKPKSESTIHSTVFTKLASVVPSHVLTNLQVRLRDITVNHVKFLTKGSKETKNGRSKQSLNAESRPWLKVGLLSLAQESDEASSSSYLSYSDDHKASIKLSSTLSQMETEEELRMIAYRRQSEKTKTQPSIVVPCTAIHALGLRPGRTYQLELVDGRRGSSGGGNQSSNVISLQSLIFATPVSPPSEPRLINIAQLPSSSDYSSASPTLTVVVLCTIDNSLNDENAQIEITAEAHSNDDDCENHIVKAVGSISKSGEVIEVFLKGLKSGNTYHFTCAARNASMVTCRDQDDNSGEEWVQGLNSMDLMLVDETENVEIYQTPTDESDNEGTPLLMFNDDDDDIVNTDDENDQEVGEEFEEDSLGDDKGEGGFADSLSQDTVVEDIQDDEEANAQLEMEDLPETPLDICSPIPLSLMLLPGLGDVPLEEDKDEPLKYGLLSVVGAPTNGQMMSLRGVDVDIRGWNASESSRSWCRVVKAQKTTNDSDIEKEPSSSCKSLNFPLESLLAPYAAALVNISSSKTFASDEVMSPCYQIRIRSVVWPNNSKDPTASSSPSHKKKCKHISGSWSVIVVGIEEMSQKVLSTITEIFNNAKQQIMVMKREADTKLAKEIASLPPPSLLLSELRLKNRKALSPYIIKRLAFDATQRYIDKIEQDDPLSTNSSSTRLVSHAEIPGGGGGVNIELNFNTSDQDNDEEEQNHQDGWEIEVQFRCGLSFQISSADEEGDSNDADGSGANNRLSIEIPLSSKAHIISDKMVPSNNELENEAAIFGNVRLPWQNDNTHVLLSLSLVNKLALLNGSFDSSTSSPTHFDFTALQAAYAACGIMRMPHKNKSLDGKEDCYEAFINIEIMVRRVPSQVEEVSATSRKQKQRQQDKAVDSLSKMRGEWSVLEARTLRLPPQSLSTTSNFSISTLKPSSSSRQCDSSLSVGYIHPLAMVAARMLTTSCMAVSSDTTTTTLDEEPTNCRPGNKMATLSDLQQKFDFFVSSINKADIQASISLLNYYQSSIKQGTTNHGDISFATEQVPINPSSVALAHFNALINTEEGDFPSLNQFYEEERESLFYTPLFGDKSMIKSCITNALLHIMYSSSKQKEDIVSREYAKALISPLEYLGYIHQKSNLKSAEDFMNFGKDIPIPQWVDIEKKMGLSTMKGLNSDKDEACIGNLPLACVKGLEDWGHSWFLPKLKSCFSMDIMPSSKSGQRSMSSGCSLMELIGGVVVNSINIENSNRSTEEVNKPTLVVKIKRKSYTKKKSSNYDSDENIQEKLVSPLVSAKKKTPKKRRSSSIGGGVRKVDDANNMLMFNARESSSDGCTSLGSSDTLYFLGFGDVVDIENESTCFAFLPVHVSPLERPSPTTSHNSGNGSDDDGEEESEFIHYSISAKSGYGLFFNPTLTAKSCEGNPSSQTEAKYEWPRLPIGHWARLILNNETLLRDCDKLHTGKLNQRQAEQTSKVGSGYEIKPGVRLFSFPRSSPPPPQLSVLLHHASWLNVSPAYCMVSGCSRYAHAPPSSSSMAPSSSFVPMAKHHVDNEDADSSLEKVNKWSLENPLQIGPCDASQRRAIALALAGESFVLRGPPGCGKTQTLATMTSALVAAGKRVLVVAKMSVALTCFEDKVKRMTGGEVGCNALGCLTSSCFLRRSGGTFRNSNDPLHAIAQEPRISAFRTRLHMASFWLNTVNSSPHSSSEKENNETEEEVGDYDEDKECCIRVLLRQGDASLTDPQPSCLEQCLLGKEASLIHMVGEWIPCAELVFVNNNGSSLKKAFVCGLCGCQKAKEASFLDHMSKHSNMSLWAKHYASRILKSHIPNSTPLKASEVEEKNNGEKPVLTSQSDNIAPAVDHNDVHRVDDLSLENSNYESEEVEKVQNNMKRAYDLAKFDKGNLCNFLANQSSLRAQQALEEKNKLDARLERLESDIHQSWKLLSTPVHELCGEEEDRDLMNQDMVVLKDTNLQALLSSIVSGANVWEEETDNQSNCDEQEKDDDSNICESPIYVFKTTCCQFVECDCCYQHCGALISETLRLLSSSSKQTTPSYAIATTLLLKLVNEVENIEENTNDSVLFSESSNTSCSFNCAKQLIGCLVDTFLGGVDKSQQAEISLASSSDINLSSGSDSHKLLEVSSPSAKYRALQKRCQLLLFALELQWFTTHFIQPQKKQNCTSSIEGKVSSEKNSVLDMVCSLQQSMVEVSMLEVRREELSLQLLSANCDENLLFFLANPLKECSKLENPICSLFDSHPSSSQQQCSDGLKLISSLNAAMNPKMIKERSLIHENCGSLLGVSSGNGNSINKVAAQQGIWRLLEDQTLVENLMNQSDGPGDVASGDSIGSVSSADMKLLLLQRMFPVFCLTPEEVAHHLPPSLMLTKSPYNPFNGSNPLLPVFDVVLFDEASQLPTLEALPCLGRAKQCVVVGDDKQLPPRDASVIGLLDECLRGKQTNKKTISHASPLLASIVEGYVSNDDDGDDDLRNDLDGGEEEEEDTLVKELETHSKPGHGMIGKMKLVPLTVHYRSGHQSLIELSNELFYNGSLGSFPSAHGIKASFPSTHKETRRKQDKANNGRESSDGGHGLVRVEVDSGIMESNNGKRDKVASFIHTTVKKYCIGLSDEEMKISYSASPQGYVNLYQAEQVFRDLVLFFDDINHRNKPMSLGIITLNRPQRALLHALVQASQKQFGLMSLAEASLAKNNNSNSSSGANKVSSSSLNGFIRDEEHRHENDEVLFIQSIDQIQGEEREVILFSTLLAPRHAAKVKGGTSSGSNQQPSSGATDQEEGDSDDDEGFDPLEQLEEGASGDSDDSDDDGGAFVSNQRRQAAVPVRALGLSYSTLAHAHGERLLNVGLTRAVRRMNVYYHPRMPAAPEHDPKPGKRSFGWLVRYLLHKPPNCPCAGCAARFQRLSQDLKKDSGRQNGSSSYMESFKTTELGITSSLENESDAFTEDMISKTTHINEPIANWGRTFSCDAAYARNITSSDQQLSSLWSSVNSTLDVGQGRFKVDVALSVSSLLSKKIVACSSDLDISNSDENVIGIKAEKENDDGSGGLKGKQRNVLINKKIAVLCCENVPTASGSSMDVRERCSVVPMILCQQKLGWDECLPFSSLTAVFKPLITLSNQASDSSLVTSYVERVDRSISNSLDRLNKGIKESFSSIQEATTIRPDTSLFSTAYSWKQVVANNDKEEDDGGLLSNKPPDVGTLNWLMKNSDDFEQSPVSFDMTLLSQAEAKFQSESKPKATKISKSSKPNTSSQSSNSSIMMDLDHIEIYGEGARDLLDSLNKKKVPELKDHLRDLGLTVSGRKSDLVNRLLTAMLSHVNVKEEEQGSNEEHGEDSDRDISNYKREHIARDRSDSKKASQQESDDESSVSENERNVSSESEPENEDSFSSQHKQESTPKQDIKKYKTGIGATDSIQYASKEEKEEEEESEAFESLSPSVQGDELYYKTKAGQSGSWGGAALALTPKSKTPSKKKSSMTAKNNILKGSDSKQRSRVPFETVNPVLKAVPFDISTSLERKNANEELEQENENIPQHINKVLKTMNNNHKPNKSSKQQQVKQKTALSKASSSLIRGGGGAAESSDEDFSDDSSLDDFIASEGDESSSDYDESEEESESDNEEEPDTSPLNLLRASKHEVSTTSSPAISQTEHNGNVSYSSTDDGCDSLQQSEPSLQSLIDTDEDDC